MKDELKNKVREFIGIYNLNTETDEFIHFLISSLQGPKLSRESSCLQSDHHED